MSARGDTLVLVVLQQLANYKHTMLGSVHNASEPYVCRIYQERLLVYVSNVSIGFPNLVEAIIWEGYAPAYFF